MTEIDFTLDEREVTTTRTFITIDGEEFRFKHVSSFLHGVSGTDGYMSYVTPDHVERDFADFLLERDIVGRKANDGLYDKSGDCEELLDEIEKAYYKDD